MSFIWMMLAGIIPSAIAKLAMPSQPAGGLFILGIGGSVIAGVMQYSMRQPVNFFIPLAGAVILLAMFAMIAQRPIATKIEEIDHHDFRKAA